MIFYILVSTVILAALNIQFLASKCLLDRRRSIAGYFIITILTLTGTFIVHNLAKSPSLFLFIAVEFVLILFFTYIIVLWMFYRDPQRKLPREPNLLVAPADGRVRYIHRLQADQLPIVDKHGKKIALSQLLGTVFDTRPCYHIGIEMNILDVHVNRIPVHGTVTKLIRIPGQYVSLRKKTAIIENARTVMVIDNGHFLSAVVQISSRMVRRIINRCHIGKNVTQGDRFGMIRFGSQVDLIFPALASMQIAVRTDQRVRAGETVIARY